MIEPWLVTINPEPFPTASTLVAGIADTAIGRLLVVTTGETIRMLCFATDRSTAAVEILRHWPTTGIDWQDAHAESIADTILNASPARTRSFQVAPGGTRFQNDVWQALVQIPFGQTTSYGHVANAAGHPTAVRAVASAIGRNPVALLIPCHRVIRADGCTGHYRWGERVKRTILDWESKMSRRASLTGSKSQP